MRVSRVIRRGQVYDWHGLRCEVTRVARDGSWADIKVTPANPFSLPWTKRQPQPANVLTDLIEDAK